MIPKRRIIFFPVLGALALIAVLILPSHRAFATPIATSTCDANIWESMEMRARMETEREIMQNQNLIFKPDSVLEYVCFDRLASHGGGTLGSIFTHTSYFDGRIIVPWGGSTGMDSAINNSVFNSLQSYIGANFAHSPLGGRGERMGLSDRTFQRANSSGPTYTCDVMANIWRTAKCMNFLHVDEFANADGYYPFINITGIDGTVISGYESKKDIRKWPTACGSGPGLGLSGSWLGSTEFSMNKSNVSYPYEAPNAAVFNNVRDLLLPGECTGPIRTGVRVILSPSGGQAFDDGVCTNPGCYYNGSGTCVGSAPVGLPPAPPPGGGPG